MKNIIYLDCYVTVGRRGPKDERAAWSTERLIEEMEHCGVHGALVTHALSKEYDPTFGNRALMSELEKSPRLLGAWAVMPDQCGDIAIPKISFTKCSIAVSVLQECFRNFITTALMR